MQVRAARIGLCCIVVITMALSVHAQSFATTFDAVLGKAQASGVALDWRTGRVLASRNPGERDLPGSVIKPLLLDYALKHGIVRASTTVYCHRNLQIGGRALPCTHPPDRATFDAVTALAESCNTWFAELAKRFPSDELENAMEQAGLRHVSLQHATGEQRELAVLGLAGVSVTPMELARAYLGMLQHGPADATLRGLRGSVEYGMANNARVARMDVFGKTGTAAGAWTARTHGWFAGGVEGRFVVVVYVPQGSGADAASLAGRLIASTAADGAVQ